MADLALFFSTVAVVSATIAGFIVFIIFSLAGGRYSQNASERNRIRKSTVNLEAAFLMLVILAVVSIYALLVTSLGGPITQIELSYVLIVIVFGFFAGYLGFKALDALQTSEGQPQQKDDPAKEGQAIEARKEDDGKV